MDYELGKLSAAGKVEEVQRADVTQRVEEAQEQPASSMVEEQHQIFLETAFYAPKNKNCPTRINPFHP